MTDKQKQAIIDKDPEYDGIFFYGLKTTHIVCRPSCNKRSCSLDNVVIFDTFEEAEKAGYRACKRCRPDQPEWNGVKQELANSVKGIIDENYEKDFSLQEIADKLHINKFYMLRAFEEVMGDTPLAYCNRVRCEKAGELMVQPELTMSYISMAVGFNSNSYFSRVFKKVTGYTPSEFRRMKLDEHDTRAED